MKHVVITIGREYGSGGRLIAKQLSEELGITFYDKELITAVARKTGFSENFIRDSEHQRPTNSFLYDLYTAVQTPSVPDQVFIAQAKLSRFGSWTPYSSRARRTRSSSGACTKTLSRLGGVRRPGAESGELCAPPGQGPRLLLQLLCHRQVGPEPGI